MCTDYRKQWISRNTTRESLKSPEEWLESSNWYSCSLLFIYLLFTLKIIVKYLILWQVFAILAFATTSGFDTTTSFTASCAPKTGVTEKPLQTLRIKYAVEYPFKFEDQEIKIYSNCSSTLMMTQTYPMEFSSSAQFYVATGVLSFLYTIACLVLYIFGSRHYETNPLIPVIDLAATGVLTIFWLSGACAWAAGVSDVKYYTKPEYLWSKLEFCDSAKNNGTCVEDTPGKWVALNISLVSDSDSLCCFLQT